MLEPKGDKVVLVHVRTAAPSGWEPLRMALSVHGDGAIAPRASHRSTQARRAEAGWLPEEMRLALKSFVSEYWELKGSSVAEAIAEFLTHIPNARLLLVGCRGQEGLSRMMSGSTSKAIVSACASVATLIVRAPIFVSEQPPFRCVIYRCAPVIGVRAVSHPADALGLQRRDAGWHGARGG